MSFTSLSRAEQRYEVEGALAPILAGLDRVAPTVVVVGRVARALGADPKEVTGLVIAVAQDGHAQARKDGDTFYRYGKKMRRWNWYPSGGPAAPAQPLAPESVASPIPLPAGEGIDWRAASFFEIQRRVNAVDRDDPAWHDACAELTRRSAASTAEIDTADW